MRNNISGRACSVVFQFEDDIGNLTVPDTGSVTYTLYGPTGAALATDVAVSATSTQVPITISAELNTKTAAYELRTLVVRYALSGTSYERHVVWRLVDFVPMAVTEDRVRAFLGVGRNELADSDIDLYAAYYQVVADTSQALVTAALSATDETNLAVNQAIICQAIIQILPSIRTRILAGMKSNTGTATRFASLDLEKLTADVLAFYYQATEILDPVDTTSYNTGFYGGLSTPVVDFVTAAAPVFPTAG